MTRPPTLREEHFDMMNTTDEEEILRRFGGFVRTLHGWLNELPCVSDLQRARRRWKRPTNTEAFGTLATDPRHWYTFHHGGRTEAQFNLGLYPTHFRVGLGFEFSVKKGGDPTVVGLYACFLQAVRSREQEFRTFLEDHRLEVEWWTPQQPGLQFVATDRVMDFLLNPPNETQWIFCGRLLRRDADAKVLADEHDLGSVITNVFTRFRPLWEETQIMASC